MKLTYNGNGEHIPGIPAQDLDDSAIQRLIEGGVFSSKSEAADVLTSRGLYSEVKRKRKAKSEDIDKAEDDE